ncbi:Hypothetical predicted protein [Paramuricea clavata]|uniref:Uncharacterized protein n=1 Tax=Paramuricea clavata TaxID=317549 RepID=A0A7D9IHW3_PARCT|nr:Hypothetical predicted protein [Paramuricea clavata]
MFIKEPDQKAGGAEDEEVGQRALVQLRERQNLEKEVEQHMLELRQIVELRNLEDNVKLAKLEEQFVVEYDQNMFDDNELTKNNTPFEFEYRSASPRKAKGDKGEIPYFKTTYKRRKTVKVFKRPCFPSL